MIIAVQGTKGFNDYETFMRAMGVALSQINEDAKIEVWSCGPHTINSFTAAFCNSSENFLKQKGYRIVFKNLPEKYVIENISSVSYFAFFSKKKDPTSKLVAAAEFQDIEVGIYRY